ncbi:MAG: outer membrane lipoprotein [Alphaproteobacteria bacterium ADurb.Bin438]|nr:MAG: outer membrane lipoprotein [Alphaproteobacteria bacterium ADurb.Bin438]
MNKKIAIILTMLMFSSCVPVIVGTVGSGVYNVTTDERDVGTQSNDLTTIAAVKSELVKKRISNLTKVKVYCYDGVVYLIGEASSEAVIEAETTASMVEGVKEIKTQWFPIGTTTNSIEDFAIGANVRGRLLFAQKVASNKLSYEVYGGNVVLLGVLSKQEEIDRAIDAVKEIVNVKDVISFLVVGN